MLRVSKVLFTLSAMWKLFLTTLETEKPADSWEITPLKRINQEAKRLPTYSPII